MTVIDLRTRLTVLNLTTLFDREQSRNELSNQFLDRLFDTYVSKNVAAACYAPKTIFYFPLVFFSFNSFSFSFLFHSFLLNSFLFSFLFLVFT